MNCCLEANRFSIYHNKALTQLSSDSLRLPASKNYFQLTLVLFLHRWSIRWPIRSRAKSETLSLGLCAALAHGVGVGTGVESQWAASAPVTRGWHPAGVTHSSCPPAQCLKQHDDEYMDRSSCSPVSGMLGSVATDKQLQLTYCQYRVIQSITFTLPSISTSV